MIKDFESLLQKMEADHKSTGPLRVRLMKYREACEKACRLRSDEKAREEYQKAMADQLNYGWMWMGIIYGMLSLEYLTLAEVGNLNAELDKIERGEEQ